MERFNLGSCLLSLAAAFGTSYAAMADDTRTVEQVDAVFDASEQPLVQQISLQDCEAIEPIDGQTGCDSPSCHKKYLLGPDQAFDLGETMLGPGSGWDVGGWSSWGFSTANDGVFATYPGHFQNNQTNLYVEKVADGSQGLGFGGHIDVMYGTDASNTQSFGNHYGVFDFRNNHGVYDWAIPQLYAEAAYDKWSIKVGHFYTLLGYQVVPATGNFFYSIPYTFNFGEAFTHTGALSTYKATDNLTLYGGYTLGWDTGFDQLGGGSSFLGGASIGITDNVTATYILTAGNLGWIGKGYVHSIVIDYVINDKWEYVIQSDLDTVDDSPIGSGGAGTRYSAVGVNQYLFYNVTDNLRAGGRVEWWKANGTSMQEMAYGLNYRPMANLLLRPEIRYNWSNGVPNFLAGGLAAPNRSLPVDYTSNALFMMDAVLTF